MKLVSRRGLLTRSLPAAAGLATGAAVLTRSRAFGQDSQPPSWDPGRCDRYIVRTAERVSMHWLRHLVNRGTISLNHLSEVQAVAFMFLRHLSSNGFDDFATGLMQANAGNEAQAVQGIVGVLARHNIALDADEVQALASVASFSSDYPSTVRPMIFLARLGIDQALNDPSREPTRYDPSRSGAHFVRVQDYQQAAQQAMQDAYTSYWDNGYYTPAQAGAVIQYGSAAATNYLGTQMVSYGGSIAAVGTIADALGAPEVGAPMQAVGGTVVAIGTVLHIAAHLIYSL